MGITTQKYELTFEWYRSPAGYQWLDIEPCDIWKTPFSTEKESKEKNLAFMGQLIPTGPFLVEIEPTLEPISWKPLDNACLFAEFADLKRTPHSFAEWASKHGRLKNIDNDLKNYTFFIYPEYTPSDKTNPGRLEKIGIQFDETKNNYHYLVKADPLEFWGAEHSDLDAAVLLWELAKNRDTRLPVLVQWTKNNREMWLYPPDREQLNKIDFDLFVADEFYRRDSCARPKIEHYTVHGINLPWTVKLGDELDAYKGVSIHLQRVIQKKLTEFPLHTIFFEDSKGSLQKAQQPSSLLSAMWYQLYLAYIGEINLRRCSICGKWEDMANRRSTWTKHAECANYERVKRARKKSRDEARMKGVREN